MSRDVLEVIAAAGFTPLGWFSPGQEHAVPDLAPGLPARTVVLIGNAGARFWQRFTAEQRGGDDPMDAWTREAVAALVGTLGRGTGAVFPFDRPYLPFQRWAQAAGVGFSSPLGLTIHPVYGLWHAYRAALLFSEPLALPPQGAQVNPCDSCADRPCLSACPVGAFTGHAYRVDACIAHLQTPGGENCFSGCLARRACPVGRAFTYRPAQARFHMEHFLKARAQPR
ncbi:hypothetical protein [Rhodoligotrophos defluvii]|uniref:hypothetical protein n=1 Tax=Rhodoligotrophos defluvii TaxID=2561934 RepID=UPI0010C9861E|nr:hypothetical protein [Rhodoligotrophos defluvii]